ncbi:MAG: TonB-dependent receptor [Bacteroidota bacterium]
MNELKLEKIGSFYQIAIGFFWVLLLPFAADGQSGIQITGQVTDVFSKEKLHNSSIVLLRAKDSILFAFARTNANGYFNIKNVAPGNYLLKISYPGYVNFIDTFSILNYAVDKDIGEIKMKLKTKMLEEVLISGKKTIRIKGDTTEFNSSAFVVAPNAKVEDVLKQLPGITVDRDGNITANGRRVETVLVDGEEFFGHDPTLVTRNIRGDMVDKIQLYEKKTELSAATGINDGKGKQTLNVVLKEDMKKGYFGKVDAGLASSNNYNGQMFANRFSGDQKAATYFSASNVQATGLNGNDKEAIGLTNSFQLAETGLMSAPMQSDVFETTMNREGRPELLEGGVHVDGKWDKGTKFLSGNFVSGKIGFTGVEDIDIKNILNSGSFNSRSLQTFNNESVRNRADLTLRLTPNTLSSFKIYVDAAMLKGNTNGNFLLNGHSSNTDHTYQGYKNIDADRKTTSQNIDLLYIRKFRKNGRSASARMLFSNLAQQSTDQLNAAITYFNSEQNLTSSTEITDQDKQSKWNNTTLTTTLNFIEPLSKKVALTTGYSIGINTGSSIRQTFNKSAAGNYSIIDSLYSGHININQVANRLRGFLVIQLKKTKISVGNNFTYLTFIQKDNFANSKNGRSFFNVNPQSSIRYAFNTQSSLSLSYSGKASPPNVFQMQAIRDNTDPLNIQVGNFSLSPEYSHNIGVGYSSFKALKNQNIYISADFTLKHNAIVNNQFTDNLGRTIFRFENLQQGTPFSVRAMGSYGSDVGKKKLSVIPSLTIDGNNYVNLVNGQHNSTKSLNVMAQLTVRQYVFNKYNFFATAGPIYSLVESQLQSALNSNGFGIYSSFSAEISLPGGFVLGTTGKYDYRQATVAFPKDFHRFILDGLINKKFLKDKTLGLSIRASDLLNNNTGFERNAFQSQIIENRHTTVRRYLMFTLIYDFNKMGNPKSI